MPRRISPPRPEFCSDFDLMMMPGPDALALFMADDADLITAVSRALQHMIPTIYSPRHVACSLVVVMEHMGLPLTDWEQGYVDLVPTY